MPKVTQLVLNLQSKPGVLADVAGVLREGRGQHQVRLRHDGRCRTGHRRPDGLEPFEGGRCAGCITLESTGGYTGDGMGPDRHRASGMGPWLSRADALAAASASVSR